MSDQDARAVAEAVDRIAVRWGVLELLDEMRLADAAETIQRLIDAGVAAERQRQEAALREERQLKVALRDEITAYGRANRMYGERIEELEAARSELVEGIETALRNCHRLSTQKNEQQMRAEHAESLLAESEAARAGLVDANTRGQRAIVYALTVMEAHFDIAKRRGDRIPRCVVDEGSAMVEQLREGLAALAATAGTPSAPPAQGSRGG